MERTVPLQEDSGMSDSTYEIINSADEESQDGRGTESVADSLDFLRPADDVRSVAGTENTFESDTPSSDDESEDDGAEEQEESHSHASSIRYADEALGSPSAHASLPGLRYEPLADPTAPFNSIEFEEEDSTVYLDKISVKHTIRDFNEQETAEIVQDMHIDGRPKRLVATVRQTMSQGCLSTTEPLRVLYVGDESARNSIVYKISRAITSSESIDYNTGKTLRRNTEGVFNIVPISSFGSMKDPDIELMATSSYQIKVETCTSAEKLEIKGDLFPSDVVYSLIIDNEKKYKSVVDSAAHVQPAWSLPHVAIFYCAESDDESARANRAVVWEFTKRHGIPSVFISETQAFKKPSSELLANFVDEHAVHLSLESRDAEHLIHPQRLPIDLNSFLNIDARQMNRNLAYLTGLQEPPSIAEERIGDVIAMSSSQTLPEPDAISLERLSAVTDFIRGLSYREVLGFLLPIVVACLTSHLMTSMAGQSQPQKPGLATVPAASVATVASTTPTATVSTTTATVTIDMTSTKTVRLTSAEPSNTILPFGGFLSDKAQAVTSEDEAKTAVCSVEMYSNNEILIKVPSGTKTTWLAKGAIDIDVYRGPDPVKSRLSTIDEGILIEINQKDAYGVLNVSVVTTRKPKVNETFAVDFGRPFIIEAYEAGKHMVQGMAGKLVDTADEAASIVEDVCIPIYNSVTEKLRDRAASLGESIEEAGKFPALLSARLSDISGSLKAIRSAWEEQLPSMDSVREDVDWTILRAQVASKLWWLKLQGRIAEHNDYERKATEFLRKKHHGISKERKMRRSTERPCQRGRSNCPRQSGTLLTRTWMKLLG
ncbi:glycosyltransferase family 15 protein [Pleurostoma richardsiae]|uniref:Glycosyltransferase family 15 protein n=1 Tax=Pleurostoma richardsiae TaxID=41990 RepID=A0AA38RGU6_9PEZI|nr:glycosyltransferase family 15 protein [Pleurostoma richardsiae]